MSFVHYLTVGRFGFTEDSVPPGLMDRVVAHFVPGGLRKLGRPTSFVVPWNEGELAELEDAVKQRYELDLDLSQYLNSEGLLCMQYTGMEVHVAFPVAAVASDLFGASAGERGTLYDPLRLREQADQHARENAERKQVLQIQDGAKRLEAVLAALRSDASFLPLGLGERYIAEVAPTIVPELLELLSFQDDQLPQLQNERIRLLALGGLRDAGPAAAVAVPKLTAMLASRGSDHFSIVLALGRMGQAAEPGLVAALDLDDEVSWARDHALQALAKLDSISDSTRAKLVEISQGDDEAAGMAMHALGESPIARRLRRLRQALREHDPTVRAQELAGRVKRGELDGAQLRLAAYLGDAASHIAIHGSPAASVDDLGQWAAGLPDTSIEVARAVMAAALDARSTSLPPRSAALTQAVARAVHEGTAADRQQELFEAHDWTNISCLQDTALQHGVAACQAVGEEFREHLQGVVEELEEGDGAAFLLLLQEEAIPLILGKRD